MSISRRRFLRLSTSSVALTALSPFDTRSRNTASSGLTIDRVTVLEVPGSFNRPVAMNAYDDAPKGKTGTIRMVRLTLSDGTTGLGVEGYSDINSETEEGVKKAMIGTNPLDVYQWDGDRIRGLAPNYRAFIEDPDYAWLETPLLDAVERSRESPFTRYSGRAFGSGWTPMTGRFTLRMLSWRRTRR